MPRPEKQSEGKPFERGVGNRRVKGAVLVDCIRCGGGKKRCRLCRNMDGKVWVKK